MTLLSEVQEIYRIDGPKKAQQEAINWYRGARDDKNDLSVSRAPKQKGYLEPGKIHIMSYNPKGKGVLDYYDKKPVVLSLGVLKRGDKMYDLAINLNFIPVPYKWYILNTVRKLYSGFFNTQILGRNSGDALSQAKIKYKYNVLKQILRKYGVEFAIRTYIPSRKSRVYVTSYDSWVNSSFLSIENFEGITYNDMIRKYKASK